jgi:predicted SnoaL-like aldol condensation-catalyzing enzyme
MNQQKLNSPHTLAFIFALCFYPLAILAVNLPLTDAQAGHIPCKAGHIDAGASQTDLNKKIVWDFYNLAFNKRKPTEAARLCLDPTYLQHNPHVADGAAAFAIFFEEYFKTHTEGSIELKRIIAEGDLVTIHVHSKSNPNDIGRAVVDWFRLKDDKIIEHWDVGMPVPNTTVSGRGVF